MRSLYIFFLSLLIVSGCKKKEEDIKLTPAQIGAKDFELIPMKDAVWKIHCVGWDFGDPAFDTGSPFDCLNYPSVDSALHTYFTIKPTGAMFTAEGKTYYEFAIYSEYDYSLKTPGNTPCSKGYRTDQSIFLREDTTAQLLLMYGGGGTDITVVNFLNEEVGKKFSGHPEMEIKYVDSLEITGTYIKRWQACNSYDKSIEVLYKAYGIGTRFGIIPSYWFNRGSKVRDIDFTYKGDNIHLSFPNY
jgi:hypothetical protein